MARILLGWELGANRGHWTALERIAASLRSEGHSVAAALQRTDALAPGTGTAIFQAPVWPRLLVSSSPARPANVSTMGDILCRLGLDMPGVLAGLVTAWDSIFDAWKPDFVVGEFAPAMLLAARGRATTVATGTGFLQPPAHLSALPRLQGEPGFDEALTLDTVDADLRQTGRDPLPALPALFAADHHLVATFTDVDPYAAHRLTSHCAPNVAMPPLSDGSGEEIFVYAFAATMSASALWDALAASGRPVRVHIPDAPEAFLKRLRGAGLKVEPRPVSWELIARRSRLIVSHGGHGLLCTALLSGVPHLVTHYDLEKSLNAAALERIGVGMGVPLRADRATITAAIASAYGDDAMAERARAAAPGFRARMDPTFDARLRAIMAG
ncbi:MAG: glycosyl transferase-like UDP-glucuronosyltransferase [Sphingomonadaceae bacterium]|nr:glycosyl transferase-like UDP-glucuronosyltransferase [Sphingomonadaceae bacterium]